MIAAAIRTERVYCRCLPAPDISCIDARHCNTSGKFDLYAYSGERHRKRTRNLSCCSIYPLTASTMGIADIKRSFEGNSDTEHPSHQLSLPRINDSAARMNDRNGNTNRPARRYRTHEEEIEEDVPTDNLPGWRFGGYSYLNHTRNSNSVVTRPSTYVPYQSFTEPDGRHAYNPAGRQYPRAIRDEQRVDRHAHTAADRRYFWGRIRPNPAYHPPGATIDLTYRGDPRNMPPPPASSVGGRDPAAGFMQHSPYPTQRPGVGGAGPATRQAGPQLQPLGPVPGQGPRQGPVRDPPFATRGGMGPPPVPQAGVRGRGSDPYLRSARGEYGNSQARRSRGNRGNRGGRR